MALPCLLEWQMLKTFLGSCACPRTIEPSGRSNCNPESSNSNLLNGLHLEPSEGPGKNLTYLDQQLNCEI